GALCPELQIGDVVLATEVRGKTALSPPSSLSALAQDLAFPWLKNGIVASSPMVLTKAREKQRLAEVLQADQPVCADMESWSIANFCSENRIPFLVARAITDAYDQDLPLDFNLLEGKGESNLNTTVLVNMLKHPHSIPGVIHLWQASRICSERLGTFVDQLLMAMKQHPAEREA